MPKFVIKKTRIEDSYTKWWKAFRCLGDTRPRGWQKDLAEKVGCSLKHINQVYLGKAKASQELQEQIAAYFKVPYFKMIEYGGDILKFLEEVYSFPKYSEVLSLPKDKRFDMIVEIAKQETGCPLVVFDSSIREKYERGEISEQEVYEAVKRHMEAVRDAIRKVDGEE